MRISDWSSDVCSSDLAAFQQLEQGAREYAAGQRMVKGHRARRHSGIEQREGAGGEQEGQQLGEADGPLALLQRRADEAVAGQRERRAEQRSEERRVGKESGSTRRYRWARYQ